MGNDMTFGSFIRAKRLAQNITLRALGEMLNLSPVHMSNIENDRRPAPKGKSLDLAVEALNLSKEDTEIMYDLAAQSKHIPTVAGDLPEYIMERDIVRVALRKAKDVDATDAEWMEFIARLEKRIVRDGEEPPGGKEKDG